MEHYAVWVLIVIPFLVGVLGGLGRSTRSSQRRYMRRYVRNHRNRY